MVLKSRPLYAGTRKPVPAICGDGRKIARGTTQLQTPYGVPQRTSSKVPADNEANTFRPAQRGQADDSGMSYPYGARRRLAPSAGSLCVRRPYLIPVTVFEGLWLFFIICGKDRIVKGRFSGERDEERLAVSRLLVRATSPEPMPKDEGGAACSARLWL